MQERVDNVVSESIHVGRKRNNGFKEKRCRVCGETEESFSHLWRYVKAREKMKEKCIKEVRKKRLNRE